MRASLGHAQGGKRQALRAIFVSSPDHLPVTILCLMVKNAAVMIETVEAVMMAPARSSLSIESRGESHSVR